MVTTHDLDRLYAEYRKAEDKAIRAKHDDDAVIRAILAFITYRQAVEAYPQ